MDLDIAFNNLSRLGVNGHRAGAIHNATCYNSLVIESREGFRCLGGKDRRLFV